LDQTRYAVSTIAGEREPASAIDAAMRQRKDARCAIGHALATNNGEV
jgi:hypothetical protein